MSGYPLKIKNILGFYKKKKKKCNVMLCYVYVMLCLCYVMLSPSFNAKFSKKH